jgi:drug/metabolite transporter (DMT)-like permease
MSQVLALVSAAFYGFADFVGGTATRRLPVWKVTAWSQMLGVGILVLGFLVVPVERVTAADLLWGAAAGVAGVIGLAILYSTLAAGTMTIVAPISGATAAAVPVLFDVLSGTTLTSRQWIGIGLAFGAVVLVGFERSARSADRRLVGRAIAAGFLFGLFFIMFSRTDSASGLWPLAAARAATIPVAFLGAFLTGTASAPSRRDLGLLAFLGNLDMAANVALALALQRGPLGVNAVLSSLYPAFTAVTAIAVHHERPDAHQILGVVFALGAIAALVF